MKKSSLILVAVAALLAILLRLIEGPMENFSAMGGLAVLCGVVVRPEWAGLLIPLAARFITDSVLEYRTGDGWYGSILFDYAAYVAIFGFGRMLQPRNTGAVLGTGVLAGLTFFCISNLGVWCMPHNGMYLYPRTLAGLVECFEKAIPFARGTFVSDVGFTLAFLGSLRAVSLQSSREVESMQVASTISDR